jgi:4-carboxymuconolactone decarboxylase
VMNLQAAAEVGLDAEVLRGVLAAIAPIVGTARIVSASTRIAEALGLDLDLEELDDQD